MTQIERIIADKKIICNHKKSASSTFELKTQMTQIEQIFTDFFNHHRLSKKTSVNRKIKSFFNHKNQRHQRSLNYGRI